MEALSSIEVELKNRKMTTDSDGSFYTSSTSSRSSSSTTITKKPANRAIIARYSYDDVDFVDVMTMHTPPLSFRLSAGQPAPLNPAKPLPAGNPTTPPPALAAAAAAAAAGNSRNHLIQ